MSYGKNGRPYNFSYALMLIILAAIEGIIWPALQADLGICKDAKVDNGGVSEDSAHP